VNGLYTKLKLLDKEIIHGELNVKDYKVILKCLLGDTLDIPALYLNLNSILLKITNLKEDELYNLNIIEYFLLLLSIRSNSIGGIIFATYNGEKKINLQIPLNEIIEELTFFLENYQPLAINIKNVSTTITIPKIKEFISKEDLSFTNNIIVNSNTTIDIEQLPVCVYKQINDKINFLKKDINNLHFYKPVVEDYIIKFSSNLNEYVSLIKILFNENLLSVYDNIFYLSKVSNFSAEYLENCTYGEFKLFVKKTENLYKNTTSTPTQSLPVEDEMDQVDIDSLYGRDLNITPSEFTP
jgi:hypothetical protein